MSNILLFISLGLLIVSLHFRFKRIEREEEERESLAKRISKLENEFRKLKGEGK